MTRGGIFPRCDSSGWVYYGYYSGDPATCVFTVPVDPDDVIAIEENDIIIIGIVHKGAGWATFPAGFNLICREISGSTRGEVYWKRAAALEVVNYSITGLADTCAAFMIALGGCITAGSPIEASTARANAAGASGTAGITTTVDDSLIFNIAAVGRATWYTSPWFTAANLPIMLGPEEFETTYGTDCNIGVAYQMMPDHGATGATAYNIVLAYQFENVGICFSLIPDPTEVPLTYDEVISTPCTNTTELTAKQLPSLPYTLVESMEDGTQDLYFKFTPTSLTQNVYFIHPWISPCYGQYTPSTDVYYYSGATKVYIYSGWPLGNFMDSFQKVLATGVTYYIHVANESGYTLDQTGIEFILQITALSTGLPVGVPHIGDLWIPDDTAGYPAALINPATSSIRGYVPYVVGERGDTLASGYQLHEDVGADLRMLYLYDPNIVLVAIVGPFVAYSLTASQCQIYGGYSDHFWVAHLTTNNINSPYLLKTVEIDGSIGAKVWTLPRPVGLYAFKSLCVNPAGTIVYYALATGTYPNYIDVIYRYDLANDVALPDLASGSLDYQIAGDRAFVMQDETIFMAYNKRTAAVGTTAFMRRYATDGSVIQDYDFDGYIIDRTCLDYNVDYFWVWCYTTADGLYGTHSHFFRVKASDGSIDKHIVTHNQQDGQPIIAANAETVLGAWDTTGDVHYTRPSIGAYNYTSDSCPMFVLRKGQVDVSEIVACPPRATITDGSPYATFICPEDCQP